MFNTSHVRICFKKYCSGDFSLKDDQSYGRPSEVDDDMMKAIIESNGHITVREIAKQLNVSHTISENHIRGLGFVKLLDIWVPREMKNSSNNESMFVIRILNVMQLIFF